MLWHCGIHHLPPLSYSLEVFFALYWKVSMVVIRFIRRREALVYNTPGDHVTRDIREGIAKLGDLRFRVLDSAGLETAATTGSILARTADMTGNVLARSQFAIFLIDVRWVGYGLLSTSHHGVRLKCWYFLPNKSAMAFLEMAYNRWISRLGNGCENMLLGYIPLSQWTSRSHLMSMEFWPRLLEKPTSWVLVTHLQYLQRQAWGWLSFMRYSGHCLRSTCFSFQTVSL